MAVTGKLKFIDFPASELAKLREATTFALEITLEGDLIEDTTKKALTVKLHACQYTGGLDPEIGSELITGEADFAAYYSVADAAQITVTSVNTIAAIAAA